MDYSMIHPVPIYIYIYIYIYIKQDLALLTQTHTYTYIHIWPQSYLWNVSGPVGSKGKCIYTGQICRTSHSIYHAALLGMTYSDVFNFWFRLQVGGLECSEQLCFIKKKENNNNNNDIFILIYAECYHIFVSFENDIQGRPQTEHCLIKQNQATLFGLIYICVCVPFGTYVSVYISMCIYMNIYMWTPLVV